MRSRPSARLLAEVLERDGLLLEHDTMLPSATAIVVGSPVRGSWWAHPRAHEIYDGLQPLHRNATRVKLIVGKATLVHRRLWPELVAIGRARQRWQLDGVSEVPAELFATVGRYRRPIWVSEVTPGLDSKTRQAAVRRLEERLLIHTDEVHTDTGAHAKQLESWRTFQRPHAIADPLPTPTAAKGTFEDIVSGWPTPERGVPLLPWMRPRNRARDT